MGDTLRDAPWVWWGLFALIVVSLIFLRLLPLGPEAGRLPGPDLVMCLACAWILRRPSFVPLWLVLMVVLFEDMVLMRPPGLWSAMMLMGTELLRARTIAAREFGFMAEWLMVAVVMFAMVIGYRLIMAVAFLPQPTFGLQMVGLGFSILAYPPVVFVSRMAFGLHKPATGELDEIGRPL
jgi:rod shape-determining protein MreD